MVSIFFSSIGVTLDHVTTKKFMGDIGKEFETNTHFKKIIEKGGYKNWIILEIFFIIIFGFSDFTLNILLWGIFWGVGRSLAAAHNFQIISEYQTIGIPAFKENNERRRQLFQRVSLINRYKMRLQYFVLFFICIVLMFSIFVIA